MPLPTPKELAKLAKACRAAGITHFKGENIEFTLGEAPVKASVKAAPAYSSADPVSEDTLSSDALLFWSSQDLPSQEEKAS